MRTQVERMAEQDSKPENEELGSQPDEVQPTEAPTETPTQVISARRLLPVGLGLVALLVGCYWWGSQPIDPNQPQTLATPVVAQSTRTEQSAAALTRVASSLAQAHEPTVTPTAASALANTNTPASTSVPIATIPLPTVTPTVIASPVATRTIEINGNATLRMQLNNTTFESNGQPVVLTIEPHSYVLGGEVMTQEDQWCMQMGPTGLVFDLIFTLQPNSGNLHVGGELQLYDGFCGTWGNLGNRLSTAPMNITIPSGSTAQLAPALQAQGSLLGLPNLLDVSTSVSLEMSIRNPAPR